MSTKDVISRHGLLKAVPYVACRALQRFMVLDITHVMIQDAEKARPRTNADGVECRFIAAEEVREFGADASHDLDPSLSDRLEKGYDFCYGGIIDGRLASYCWFALDSIERKHNRASEALASGLALSYPADHAFRYKGFTHPHFRGRGLYAVVATAASIAMQEIGVRYIVSTAEVVNYAAVKSSLRCGYENIGKIAIIGIGDRAWAWTTDLSHRGILFGRAARVVDRDSLGGLPDSGGTVDAEKRGEPLIRI